MTATSARSTDRPRVVAIVQARMGSTRLPGKILRDIAGESMLSRVVKRVQRSESVAEVIVATTDLAEDDVTAERAGELGVTAVRGSREDVLDRYRVAAQESNAAHIVRITADCPFIDPGLIDRSVSEYLDAGVDYASTKVQLSFPVGLDTEVFSREALERTWRDAHEWYERAHVTYFMYSHPGMFSLLAITTSPDRHEWRWTVDTPEDLDFARAVHERLGGGIDFSWQDVAALIERQPELASINSHISAKAIAEG